MVLTLVLVKMLEFCLSCIPYGAYFGAIMVTWCSSVSYAALFSVIFVTVREGVKISLFWCGIVTQAVCCFCQTEIICVSLSFYFICVQCTLGNVSFGLGVFTPHMHEVSSVVS